MAQLVAHLHDAQGVRGSSPLRPTSLSRHENVFARRVDGSAWGVAQARRTDTPVSYPRRVDEAPQLPSLAIVLSHRLPQNERRCLRTPRVLTARLASFSVSLAPWWGLRGDNQSKGPSTWRNTPSEVVSYCANESHLPGDRSKKSGSSDSATPDPVHLRHEGAFPPPRAPFLFCFYSSSLHPPRDPVSLYELPCAVTAPGSS